MLKEGAIDGSCPGLSITILGPVGARRGGVELSLPAGRPRVVLAVLALRPGHVVGVDVLEEFLWPEAPPENPRNTIQTHVARLRHVLGRDTIRASAGGYVLDVQPDVVDLESFRALASAAAAATDPADELNRLVRALALWQGDPLSGLTPSRVETEHAAPIVEELLNATERVNELRLQFGHLDELLRSARGLVAAHPWRERTWAHLMLALYRQGRQSDALAAFHDLSHVLRTDLGIDPGAELTALHARILAGDAELLKAQRAPARPDHRPAQLPPPVPDFIGRGDQADRMIELLTMPRSCTPVAVVSGPGGAGKSALAMHVAHRIRHHYPDGQLFAELRGPQGRAEHGDVLSSFLRALGVAPAEVPASAAERTGLFRTLCDRRRILVVLDDAHTADELVPLMPGNESCGVIITSRPPLTHLPVDVRIDLGFFDRGESQRLLERIVGTDRTATDPISTAAITEACEGSPLALRIAGGRIAARPSWPLAHFAQRLSAGNRLDELAIGGLGVRTMLEASHDDLEPEVAQRFWLLAAAPEPTVDVEFAAVAWNEPEAEARATLESLADVRLIEAIAPDRYSWHDLVADYLNDQAGSSHRAALDGVTSRLVSYYLRSLDNTKAVLRPGAASRARSAWFPHESQGRTFANQADLHTWLHPRCRMIDGLARRVLGTPGAQHADRAAAIMLLIGNVAYECCDDSSQLEDTSRAILEAAAQPLDRLLVASAWHSLSLAHSEAKRFDESLAAAAAGLTIRREIGDRFGEVTLLNNMGRLYQRAGRHQEAAELLEVCAAADDVLSPQLRAMCLRNLGEAQLSLNRLDEGRRSIEAALDLSPPHPMSRDAFYQAIAEVAIHHLAADHDAALASCAEAVSVAEQLGAASLLAAALVKRGHVHMSAGEPGVAVRVWTEALELPAGLNDADAGQVRRFIADAARSGSAAPTG